jgi:hypothetical protein
MKRNREENDDKRGRNKETEHVRDRIKVKKLEGGGQKRTFEW